MTRRAWTRALFVLIPFLLAPALAGCDEAPFDPERDRLAENLRRWRSAEVTSYSYVYRASCFCPPDLLGPFEVTVEDGEVVSVVSVETGEPAEPVGRIDELTVEGLFAFLIGALEDEPAAFEATYDPALGHPRSAFVDFDARVADEEFGFEARDLSAEPRPLSSER